MRRRVNAIGWCGLAFVLLLAARIGGWIDWPWLWILSPLWGGQLIRIVMAAWWLLALTGAACVGVLWAVV